MSVLSWKATIFNWKMLSKLVFAFGFLLVLDAKLVQVELFKAPNVKEHPNLKKTVGLSHVEQQYESE